MNPGLLLAGLIAWGLSLLIAASLGYDHRDGEVAQEKLEIAKAYADWAEQEQGIARGLSSDLAAARAAQAPKDRIITREVARYVQVTPAEHRCQLPAAWRMLHDAAATGTPIATGPGSVAFGAGAGVEDAAAIETVADNYAAARECGEKLDGWIERYHRLEAPRATGAPQ